VPEFEYSSGSRERLDPAAQTAANVAVLVELSRALATIDQERTRQADVRAGGLAVIANGLLAIAVTLGGRLGQFDGSATETTVLSALYVLGLVLLLAAGISAALALRLTAAPAFRLGEIAGYRKDALQRSESLTLKKRVLRGWINTIASERMTYDTKIEYLHIGYGLFVTGLVALVAVAAMMTQVGS
jgi:hypothetical protein